MLRSVFIFSLNRFDKSDTLSDGEHNLFSSLIIFDVLVELVQFLASHVTILIV